MAITRELEKTGGLKDFTEFETTSCRKGTTSRTGI